MVLVIDDNDVCRQYAVETLRSCGVTVKQARNARQGRALALSRHPGLIYVDLNLPDGNGIDLCASIRRSWPREYPPPRYVAVTAASGRGLTRWARSAGFETLLRKPVSVEAFQASLHIQGPVSGRSKETKARRIRLYPKFCHELRRWLPRIEQGLLNRGKQRRQTMGLLHRLMGSCAICNELELELHSRLLHDHLAADSANADLAQAWYDFVLEANRCLSRAPPDQL
jgi:CheY-like chemotaxis protein